MFKRAVLALVCFVLCLSFMPVPTLAQDFTIGFLGDSNIDEYRSNDNRAYGTPYAETTLSWAELLINERGFDAGKWGRWGEPRRSGYAYNWSRSGATTESMISSGQHTGLAKQIAAGDVEYVIIWIGTNDFNTWNDSYTKVYNGDLSDKELDAKIESIVQNITLAVDTLLESGEPKILLANFADPGQSIEFMTSFPSSEGRQRVTDAITRINSELDELAQSRALLIVDINQLGASLFSRIDSTGNLVIGGETISAITRGYEPHHLQLDDSAGHIGTVGSGLVANLFIETLVEGYGLPIEPFTDAELLLNAGIESGS